MIYGFSTLIFAHKYVCLTAYTTYVVSLKCTSGTACSDEMLWTYCLFIQYFQRMHSVWNYRYTIYCEVKSVELDALCTDIETTLIAHNQLNIWPRKKCFCCSFWAIHKVLVSNIQLQRRSIPPHRYSSSRQNRDEKREKMTKITAEWLSGLMHWNNLPASPKSWRERQRDKIRREKGRW